MASFVLLQRSKYIPEDAIKYNTRERAMATSFAMAKGVQACMLQLLCVFEKNCLFVQEGVATASDIKIMPR
jgi:hypothetical protein